MIENIFWCEYRWMVEPCTDVRLKKSKLKSLILFAHTYRDCFWSFTEKNWPIKQILRPSIIHVSRVWIHPHSCQLVSQQEGQDLNMSVGCFYKYIFKRNK